MKESHILGMIKMYLDEYRINPQQKNPYFPFRKNVIIYTAHRASMNPRRVILALRAALFSASISNIDVIDLKFVNKYHVQMFGGFENKVADFLEKKWTYVTVR